MDQTTDGPYLTVAEAAGMLGMTPDGVYKLIKRDKLPALRLSERGLRVTRWALEAYRDSLNGRGPRTRLPEDALDLEALWAAFEEQTGMSPEDWVAAWKRDAVADTAENNSLLVQALALRERSAGDAEEWTVAALAPRATMFHRRTMADRGTDSSALQAINGFIQARLRMLDRDDVPAVEAACWLDTAGLLENSESRPGLPLRNLLRDGQIVGADQRPAHRYGRWFITRI